MKTVTAADFSGDQNPAKLTPKYKVGQHVSINRAPHESMYKQVFITDIVFHPATKHWPAHVGYLVSGLSECSPKGRWMYDEEHVKPANC